MKVVAYLRTSTDRQDLDNQKLAILSFAQQRKIVVDRFLSIQVSSRRNLKERLIEELFSILEDGDLLIVSELSRLGRSLGQIIEIVNELIKKGIKLACIKENINLEGEQDIQTKVTITLFGLFAEIERDLISQRTKDGLQAAREKGRKGGRPKGIKGKSKLDGKEEEIAKLLGKEISRTSIAKLLSVSRGTLNNFIKTRKIRPKT